MTLYSAYRRKKLAYGGYTDPYDPKDPGIGAAAAVNGNQQQQLTLQQQLRQQRFGQAVGTIGTLGAGVLDATGKLDPLSGRQSTGTVVGKSALQGAAMGAQFGPLGAGIGAGVGAGIGLLTSEKQKRDARNLMAQGALDDTRNLNERSSAVLGGNPSLLSGYQGRGYYAFGGPIGDPPTGATYKTQADVDAANEMARRITAKKHPDEPSLIANSYVATKPGDPVAPIEAKKSMVGGRTLATTVPRELGYEDLQSADGHYWYNDPHTGDMVEVDPSVSSLPQFRRPTTMPVKAYGGRMSNFASKHYANGGAMTAPLATAFMSGGNAKSLSSDNAEIQGPSHEQGGVQIPVTGAEVEGGETTKGDYVFSRRLGFAQQARPIAIAKGKIEKKPLTMERMNSLTLLNAREQRLQAQQEQVKQRLNLQ